MQSHLQDPFFLHCDSQLYSLLFSHPLFILPDFLEAFTRHLHLTRQSSRHLGAQRGATKGNKPHPSSLLTDQTTPGQPFFRDGESASSGRCWRQGMPRSHENPERCPRQLRTVQEPWGVTQNQLRPSDSSFISHLQGEPLNRRVHLCSGS